MTALSIVHVVRSDGFAGVERHIASLAAGQAADGHRVAVIGGDAERMRATLEPLGVPLLPAATVWEALSALRRFAGADVLHAHMTAAELAVLLSFGQRRAPLVVTRHFAVARGRTPPARAAAVAIRARVAAQIAVSRYVAERIDGPSTVVYPAVATAERIPAASRSRVVLLAQRLEPEKRSTVALDAFAASGLAASGWVLQIAGSGSERRALEEQAARLGLGKTVSFLGARRDVEALMATAGLLIAPCDVEGLGLSVLEAMATGLPVVAAAAGGHLETAGRAGESWLFPSGDPASAAARLRELAADDSARESYGRALWASQRERFTLGAQLSGTEQVYRGVL